VLILLLTALNVRGVRLGAVTQNLIMVTKIAGMVGVILLGFWAAFRGTEPELPAVTTVAPGGSLALGAAGAALLSVVFSYGGFQNVSAAAAEIKNPQRTVPLSILVGTVGVIALYVALNWSLVTILGVEGVARSATPVADAAGAVLPQGRFWVALLILCSTFGITQVLLMVTPRIYYAMSRDGLFFPAVGAVHPRYGTPHVAIALQAGFSILHLFLGEHLNLLQVTTLLDWVFFGLCGVAFFRLRWTAPELPRPYRAFGYPVLPACFLLLCVTIVVNAVLNAERVAVWRAGVIAAVGVVLFLVSQRSGPGRTA
jgi:APA family basic amino acid/polyamine antiporter